MKTKFKFLFLILFSFSACDKSENEEDINNSKPTPWERKFYGGQHDINNVNFFTTEINGSTNINFDCSVCKSNLPSDIFTTATIKIYLPKHPTDGYQTGFETKETNRVIIRYDGGKYTNDVYQSGSISFIGTIQDPNDSTKLLSGFQFSLQIPSNYNITKNNFEFIDFPFYLIYLDENGNEIFMAERNFTILNANC